MQTYQFTATAQCLVSLAVMTDGREEGIVLGFGSFLASLASPVASLHDLTSNPESFNSLCLTRQQRNIMSHLRDQRLNKLFPSSEDARPCKVAQLISPPRLRPKFVPKRNGNQQLSTVKRRLARRLSA